MNRKEKIQLLLLFFIVLVSRIPFLFAGYGAEEDSWGIVRAVMRTVELGSYEPSRLPGHPVAEAIYLLFPHGNYFAYNFVSAIFSACAVLFFALSLRTLGSKRYLLLPYTLAFIPVFYTGSTYTIDYCISLAFAMMSFYALLKDRAGWAGLLLGMATGCRITSIVFLIPFSILFYYRTKSFLHYPRLLLFTLFFSAISYLPVIVKFGGDFFTYYDQFGYPPFTKILYKASIGVFGSLGIIALLYALVILAKNKFTQKGISNFESGIPGKLILISIIPVLIFILAYLKLPQKSAYLIPALPFILILLSVYLDEKKLRWTCFLLLLSPFAFGFNLADDKRGSVPSALSASFRVSGQEICFDMIKGPLWADISKRKQKMNYVDHVIEYCAKNKENRIVISGWWYNEIEVTLHRKNLPGMENNFVFYIDKEQMDRYRADGYELYYLPEQERYNDEYSKMDYTAQVAKPLEAAP